MSRDPIEEDGGINLYGYVANNPIEYIDPDGRLALPFVIPQIPVWVQNVCIGLGLGGLGVAYNESSDDEPQWPNDPRDDAESDRLNDVDPTTSDRPPQIPQPGSPPARDPREPSYNSLPW